MTLVRQCFTEPLYALTDKGVILIMLGTNRIITALKGSGRSRVFLANWKRCAGETKAALKHVILCPLVFFSAAVVWRTHLDMGRLVPNRAPSFRTQK